MRLLKTTLAAAAILGAAVPAHANLEKVLWSGAQFDNSATAVGIFDIKPGTELHIGGVFPNSVFQLISLTVSGASSGNGDFSEADFHSYHFTAAPGLDYSKQLIGQPMTNGCNYGDFTSPCYGGGSGDFNIFAIGLDPGVPSGIAYFTLSADLGTGDAMALVSIAPDVPEPATWTLMAIGFGLVGGRRQWRRGSKSAILSAFLSATPPTILCFPLTLSPAPLRSSSSIAPPG